MTGYVSLFFLKNNVNMSKRKIIYLAINLMITNLHFKIIELKNNNFKTNKKKPLKPQFTDLFVQEHSIYFLPLLFIILIITESLVPKDTFRGDSNCATSIERTIDFHLGFSIDHHCSQARARWRHSLSCSVYTIC